jgi:tripeptide aminopeptidase
MTHDTDTIRASAQFQKATDDLRAGHDKFVGEIITLTEIPSPPFKEEKRAAAYEEMFRALGLEDVQRDGIGNVTGLRRGRGNGPIVVAAAHLDTVFPEGTDVKVRREGTKLFAPGVGDDTRGLAALLAFIRALDAGGIETEQDILFVGDVGEEGKGDLRGVRYLFTENAYRERIASFFTFDGIETQDLVTAGVGSYRYKVAFKGPGGHSLGAFGTVNPAYALGTFLVGMSKIEVPGNPRSSFCASTFQGGTSVNAIPEEVWTEIDLRSESAEVLNRVDGEVKALIEAAVAGENARGDTTNGQISVELTQIGNRPAGTTAHNTTIVEASVAAIKAYGFEPAFSASSTDANIPMAHGVPAVKFSHGGAGGRAHTVDEWIDVEPELSLRGLNAGLLALVATAGFVES